MRRLFFWLNHRPAAPAPRRAQPRHEAKYTFDPLPPGWVPPALASETTEQLVARLQLETGQRAEREDC